MRSRSEDVSIKEVHRANRPYRERSAPGWEELRDRDQLWRGCLVKPDLAFAGTALEPIRRSATLLRERETCVLGSSHNCAALAGTGARVSSTDIAQSQLEVAEKRAAELSPEIHFLRAVAAEKPTSAVASR